MTRLLKSISGFQSVKVRVLSVLTLFCALLWAGNVSAQANYGGISGFTKDFPIVTYQQPEEGTPLKQAPKRLTKDDVGVMDEILILAVYAHRGRRFVEIETESGDYWVRRDHIKPVKQAQVDRDLEKSKGSIFCPQGGIAVPRMGTDRNTRAGVGRGLGGVSVSCVKDDH